MTDVVAAAGSRLVHVIDDDDDVRASLSFLLRTSGFRVEAHPSADAFLTGLHGREPGCVVTDVRMPGTSGLDLLEKLADRRARFPVIVVTGHGEVSMAVAAMRNGAVDFLEKPFEEDAILGALELANRTTGAAAGSAVPAPPHPATKRIAALAPRERQVLERLVEGKSNKAVALDLGISPRTVEVYRASLMTKMQVQSLPELVRLAMHAGFGE